MRPRGLASPWVKILPWYYDRQDEPSRRAELEQALAFEEIADGEHDRPWCNLHCRGAYDEWCGDSECHGCVPTHCPCRCHTGKCGCGVDG